MAELASHEYAFLIILRDAGRELSNTEMDKAYKVRLVSPEYEKLNADGYVASRTKGRPYRHVITDDGLKKLAEPLSIDDDHAEEGETRSPERKLFWAALVAQQKRLVGPPAGKIADLDGRIRAAYAELADPPGALVGLAALRSHLPDVSRAELDGALARMLDADDVRLEPDQLKHRISAEDRKAAIHVSGEDRHKLAIGRP